jgi:hypothetical protein
MDAWTLKYILKKILCKCKIKKFYVIGKNKLEIINLELCPIACIINSENHDVFDRGHWLACIIHSPDKAEFYDSYGFEPKYYQINIPVSHVVSHGKAYQHDKSSVCGLYCLLYIYLRSRNYSISYFHSLFNVSNKIVNDNRVIKFYKQFKTKHIKRGGQTCCCKNKNINHV